MKKLFDFLFGRCQFSNWMGDSDCGSEYIYDGPYSEVPGHYKYTYTLKLKHLPPISITATLKNEDPERWHPINKMPEWEQKYWKRRYMNQ